MEELRSLLKTIRAVGRHNPVTAIQLSEIIRKLYRSPLRHKSEVMSGVVDGINRDFTTSEPYISGTIIVTRNGLEEGFAEVDEMTIRMDRAPLNKDFTDKIKAFYTIKN